MHFFKSLLVGATALVAAVSAQSTTLTFTRAVDTAQVGQNVLLQYIAPQLDQPVTILLRKGPASDLQTVSTITDSATGGSYEWTVPNVASGENYALQIEQGDQVNYFGPLAITGGTGGASMTGYLPNPMSPTATRTLATIPSGGAPPPVAGGSSTPAPTSNGPSRPRPTGNGGSGGSGSSSGGEGGEGGSGGGSAITSANQPQNTGAASVNRGHAGLVLGLVGAFAAFA